MLGLIILIVLFIGGVSCHSYGADLQACDTLKPGHGGVLRQRTPTPYVIQTNNQYYVPCQTQPMVGRMMNCGVIVRITARRPNSMNGQFKGFLIQARSRNINGQIMNVGEFRYMNGNPILMRNTVGNPGLMRTGTVMGPGGAVALGQVGNMGGFRPNQMLPGTRFGQTANINPMLMNTNVVVQRMNCPRGFSVTHTENRPKNNVILKWYPPVGYNQPVQFLATVVRDYNTYWMNHRSRTIRPNRSPGAMNRVSQTMRWFSGATRATSGLVAAITALSCLFLAVMY